MYYFAYGSNLNHYQMKSIRCIGSKYIQNTFLQDYQLSFCHPKKENIFGYANAHKKKGSKVPGAIWEITEQHENALDKYEGFPISYRKEYFYLNKKKIMFYIMDICFHKNPSQRYINVIKEGYINCNLDLNYLKKRLSHYNIKYSIK